eukprot:XP_010648986.1 PREDICTED: uncharacterized protein LOC100256234 [Vitis vinifera]
MNGNVIIVAVDASKEITDYALEWAVRNLIKAMDSLILLAVVPSCGRPLASRSQTHQFLSCLLKKLGLRQEESSTSDQAGLVNRAQDDASNRINGVCVQMMQQLCLAHNVKQVQTAAEVLADAEMGAVATKAGELGATWIILDRRLKKESDCCLKQLDCNVVLIDHAIPRILRAVDPPKLRKLATRELQTDPTVADMLGIIPTYNLAYNPDCNSLTTRSSLGLDSPCNGTDASSFMSNDKDKFSKASPSVADLKPVGSTFHLNSQYFHQVVEVEEERFDFTPSYSKSQPLAMVPRLDTVQSPQKSPACTMKEKTKACNALPKIQNDENRGTRRSIDSPRMWRNLGSPKQSTQLTTRRDSMATNRIEPITSPLSSTIDRTSSIRKTMSLSIKHPPTPPPLCSVCKHNAPIFGKAPRKFDYKEIIKATDGFSRQNFLAEGGYGAVYRGVLPDGQVVAVKQHKMLSAQGASEFCSEVEVLRCAQHRNLVMLVGYCVEVKWILVYEFACNGSLDKHLYGRETNEVMSWDSRMKVALGAARGLRYLHEDCRVGCIVHRDFRPTNILLTHDFEPMVGDFGLARWQADGQTAEETRVIGAFGYLAPEYTQTGLITEKADVYAFGVVLLELLSGCKATELSRHLGQQLLLDWGCPLLEMKMIDPRLEDNYVAKEVECMMVAASLCLTSPGKETQNVLKILEGDVPGDHMANRNGHHISFYQKQESKKVYGADKPLNETIVHSPSSHLMRLKHHMKFSPSRVRPPKYNDWNGSFKPMTPSDKRNEVNSSWGLNQSEEFSGEEYHAYLQGSLAKFIQNLNAK